MVAEVKVNGAIESLDLVLDEKRHFDVAVLKEFVQLLLHYPEISGIELRTHLLELSLSVFDILECISAFNQSFDCL